jgi:hypothetical protein
LSQEERDKFILKKAVVLMLSGQDIERLLYAVRYHDYGITLVRERLEQLRPVVAQSQLGNRK